MVCHTRTIMELLFIQFQHPYYGRQVCSQSEQNSISVSLTPNQLIQSRRSVLIESQTVSLPKIHRQTIEQFGLDQCHVSGMVYYGYGLLAIFKVAVGETPQLMYYLLFKDGCILRMQWCPKFSQSEQEIGLLALLNSQGAIDIASVAICERRGNHIPVYDGTSIQTIKLDHQHITAFDWMVNRENDIMAIGDQNGSVYLIKLVSSDLNPKQFVILNIIQQLHLAEITDLKFYLHSDVSTPLLASTSYDGTVKVLTPMQCSDPVLDLSLSSKGVLEIEWDCGGKYIQVIRDDPASRALLISLFPVEKGPKGQEAGYDLCNQFETRYLGSLSSGPNEIVVSSSSSNGVTYFSNQGGKIYGVASETIRKLSVKKEKKQTQQAQLISHITIDEGSVTIHEMNNAQDAESRKRKSEISLLNQEPFGTTCFRSIHVCPSDVKCEDFQSYLVQGGLQGVLVLNKLVELTYEV